MIVDDLVKRPGCWLLPADGDRSIVSSRVRLARNVRGFVFPGRADAKRNAEIWALITGALAQIPATRDALVLMMSELSEVEKDILKERQLISRELAEKGPGSGVVVAQGEQIAVMINEEDHLRMQALSPGLNLEALWQKMDDLDSELERRVEYAFSIRLGYLTACPSNAGTALRASVMMHLPGLRLMGEIEAVVRGLERIGLAVRGLQGEGSEAVGDLYQISNQPTLGRSESAVIGHLLDVVQELAEHEEHARQRVAEQRSAHLLDEVGRSHGVLTNAHVLSSREAVDLLSSLRLGVEFRLVQNLTVQQIHEIVLLTQPGHLQRLVDREMEGDERDEARA